MKDAVVGFVQSKTFDEWLKGAILSEVQKQVGDLTAEKQRQNREAP